MNVYNDKPTGKSLTPATFYHLEILLIECGDRKFKAIMEWMMTGLAPGDYSHQNHHYNGVEEYSYIEVLLPAINIFDTNLIEHIHIDETEFKMSSDDIRAVSMLTTREIKPQLYYHHYQTNRFHLFPASY